MENSDSTSTKKPCANCRKDCDIFPIQLGDWATLQYLRLCNAECLFNLAWEYLYDLNKHRDFRNSLYAKELPEDAKERDVFIKARNDYALNQMRKSLEENPKLLTNPIPERALDLFITPGDSCNSGTTIRFQRFVESREDRLIRCERVRDDLQRKLTEAQKNLEEALNEKPS